MLKAIKVVDDIPQRKRGGSHEASITQKMADDFVKSLMLAQGKWVQYFDEPYANQKESDRMRNKARNLIQCAAMKPYEKRVEMTTRSDNGRVVAFARWI